MREERIELKDQLAGPARTFVVRTPGTDFGHIRVRRETDVFAELRVWQPADHAALLDAGRPDAAE